MLKLLITACLIVCIQACGVIRDRTDDYLQVKDDTELVYPDNQRNIKADPKYSVPSLSVPQRLPRSFVVPEPPDATAILSKDPYLVERIDDERWLKLFASPGQTWPMLKLYLEERGVPLNAIEPDQGKLETHVILPNSKSTPWLNGLQAGNVDDMVLSFDVEQGLRRNTSNLMARVTSEQLDEKQKDVVEAKLLRDLGEFLSDESNIARHSLKATEMEVDSLVKVKTDRNGWDYIEVRQSFQRAWYSVLRALEESDAAVSDIDRSKAVIYLDALELEEVSGLASWFSSQTRGDALANNIMISLVDLGDDLIQVRVFLLNPNLEDTSDQDVLELIYDYIS